METWSLIVLELNIVSAQFTFEINIIFAWLLEHDSQQALSDTA